MDGDNEGEDVGVPITVAADGGAADVEVVRVGLVKCPFLTTKKT